MKNGDLSNYAPISIGVSLESLVQFKEGGLKNTLLNTILGEYSRADLNLEMVAFVKYIYLRTEYTVYIVTNKEHSGHSLIRFLDSNTILFSDVIIVNEVKDITDKLRTNEITYYVDTDESRISLVNSPYAMNLAQINQLLRGDKSVRHR